MAGMHEPSPLRQARHQILLGDDTFVSKYQDEAKGNQLRDISKAQRRAIALELPVYQARYRDRNEAMAHAYLSGAYTMK